MQRIDSPDQRFHDGNPATGALGTPVTGAFLNSAQEEICRAIELAGIALDGTSTRQLYDAIVKIIAAKVQAPVFVGTTPAEKVGDLIFVLDRMHWATWVQTAFYTGYRSLNVGDWYIGSMCLSHRPQEIDGIGGIYDIAAFPSLWGWAQEQNKVVDAGDWEPHGTQYALIGTTQFRVPDYRDMFPRAAGTDRDTANAAGAGVYQSDAMQKIAGSFTDGVAWSNANALPGLAAGAIQVEVDADPSGRSGGGVSYKKTVSIDTSLVVRTSDFETRAAAARVASVICI